VDNKTEQMILLVDAGNSAIKWTTSGTEGLSDMLTQAYPENITVAFFTNQWMSLNKPLKVVVSCVASESVWQALQLWNIEVDKVISLKEGFGLTNAYENPADLGSDRWCAMIAANQLEDSAFIVVSVGSALTIDMVNGLGQHLGGLITPGLSMMRQSLGAHTAQVKVQTSKDSTPSLSLANSTKACVEAGIHLSVVKLIEAVYEQESKQVKNLQCFLAGGNAALIADLLPFKCVMIPDLVLRGLAVIATAQSENKNI
jgi:type III pantothenate kinase